MKNSRILTLILLLAVFLVWGAVGYRVFSALASSSGEEAIEPAADLSAVEAAELYHYSPDTRDPFTVSHPLRHEPRVKHPLPKEIWTLPPLRLSGIVARGRSLMALIEGVDGSVSFLQKGDTLKGVKILRVAQDSVTYSYRKKQGGWKLERP
jgi:Tfp pilus assembly protein PilP